MGEEDIVTLILRHLRNCCRYCARLPMPMSWSLVSRLGLCIVLFCEESRTCMVFESCYGIYHGGIIKRSKLYLI